MDFSFASWQSKAKALYKSLSPERVFVVWVALLCTLIFLFTTLIILNDKVVTYIPSLGGKFTEGIVGVPRYINPVLATSEQDKDLTALVFAGLMKKDESGQLIPDLAQTIEKSDDGLKYTVTLKSWARFHDGTALTADDVLYTISLIQDPLVKSAERIKWEGVKVDKVSDTELTFTLKQPYPQFLDALAVGILPKHLWKDLTPEELSLSDYNINAIGAGPYAIDSIELNSGIPKSFTLKSHKYYTLGRPYLAKITIVSFQNEKLLLEALADGTITRIHGISPTKIASLSLKSDQIIATPLPRTFTLFLNANKAPFLADRDIRKALDMAIDKEAIVNNVYKGYAHIANTPYPLDNETFGTSTFNLDTAKSLLTSSGYMKKHASSTLAITITIGNTDDAKAVAESVKKNWEALGVTTSIEIYESADLNQSIIKDRNFESVLVGTLVRHPSDLYAFWHSSQRKYPGLNISGYASSKLDTNLEELRTADDPAQAASIYEDVRNEFETETPSIFLYTPSLVYIKTDKVVTKLPAIADDGSSRFSLINREYLYQEKVWKGTDKTKIINFINEILH